MAYKMNPTKKKNKNGGINKIVKGIAEAGKHLLIPGYSIIKVANKALTKVKPKAGILPGIQSEQKYTKTLTSKPKVKAVKKKNVKDKLGIVSNVKPATKGIQPTAKPEVIKGNANIKKVIKPGAKPKKVKVKIKHNKTKIKIKK